MDSKQCPIDAHVHLHPDFNLAKCLSAAADHMAPHWGLARTGVLVLTEMAGRDAFTTLRGRQANWTFEDTAEAESRVARHDSGMTLLVIAGRQIATSEGLEVHGLGMVAVPPDRLSLLDALAAVEAAGALTVLPWGVGKWTGTRAKIVTDLIARDSERRDIFLADSGVRPSVWPRPGLLAAAEAEGWRILAGSDPLPLPGEEIKPGRFGFLLPSAPDLERPFANISAKLRALPRSPQVYGTLEGLPRFLDQQARLQWRKRFAGR